jgi:hypothetical protein
MVEVSRLLPLLVGRIPERMILRCRDSLATDQDEVNHCVIVPPQTRHSSWSDFSGCRVLGEHSIPDRYIGYRSTCAVCEQNLGVGRE